MNAVRISLRSKVHLLAFRSHFLPSIVHGTKINQLERMLLVFQMFTRRIQPLKQGQNKLRSLSVITESIRLRFMLPVVKHLVETGENQFRPCYKVK